jgi:hypothetical protein
MEMLIFCLDFPPMKGPDGRFLNLCFLHRAGDALKQHPEQFKQHMDDKANS